MQPLQYTTSQEDAMARANAQGMANVYKPSQSGSWQGYGSTYKPLGVITGDQVSTKIDQVDPVSIQRPSPAPIQAQQTAIKPIETIKPIQDVSARASAQAQNIQKVEMAPAPKIETTKVEPPKQVAKLEDAELDNVISNEIDMTDKVSNEIIADDYKTLIEARNTNDSNAYKAAMSDMVNRMGAQQQAERLRMNQLIKERGMSDQGVGNSLMLNLARSQGMNYNTAITDMQITELNRIQNIEREDEQNRLQSLMNMFGALGGDANAQIELAKSLSVMYPNSFFADLASNETLQNSLKQMSTNESIAKFNERKAYQKELIYGIDDIDNSLEINEIKDKWIDSQKATAGDGLSKQADSWFKNISLEDMNALMPDGFKKNSLDEFSNAEKEDAYLESRFNDTIQFEKEQRIEADIYNTLASGDEINDSILSGLIGVHGGEAVANTLKNAALNPDSPEFYYLLYNSDGQPYTDAKGVNPYYRRNDKDKSAEAAWGKYLDVGGNASIGYQQFLNEIRSVLPEGVAVDKKQIKNFVKLNNKISELAGSSAINISSAPGVAISQGGMGANYANDRTMGEVEQALKLNYKSDMFNDSSDMMADSNNRLKSYVSGDMKGFQDADKVRSLIDNNLVKSAIKPSVTSPNSVDGLIKAIENSNTPYIALTDSVGDPALYRVMQKNGIVYLEDVLTGISNDIQHPDGTGKYMPGSLKKRLDDAWRKMSNRVLSSQYGVEQGPVPLGPIGAF